MGERNFQKKQRNVVNRRRKPVMVITAEGNNKTEQLYFTSFQNQHGKYSLKFVKTSKDTDPSGLQKSMETYWNNNELSRKSKNVKFIVSNPYIMRKWEGVVGFESLRLRF